MLRQKIWKRIRRFLIVWDGLWSIPFTFLAFMGFTYWGEWMWPPEVNPDGSLSGGGFAGMNPEYIQKLLYAAVIMVGINLAAWLAIFFNFHKVWDYYLGDSGKDFQSLSPQTKICLVILLYFAFYLSGLLLVLIPV